MNYQRVINAKKIYVASIPVAAWYQDKWDASVYQDTKEILPILPARSPTILANRLLVDLTLDARY